jgi:hypothetical protein
MCLLLVTIDIFLISASKTFNEQINSVPKQNLLNTHFRPHLKQRCPVPALEGKIYIYPLPERFNTDVVDFLRTKPKTDWLGIFKTGPNITNNLTNWRTTMLDFATEIYLHNNFAQSGCSTSDPNNALWFFIPSYTFYLFWYDQLNESAWFDGLLNQVPTCFIASSPLSLVGICKVDAVALQSFVDLGMESLSWSDQHNSCSSFPSSFSNIRRSWAPFEVLGAALRLRPHHGRVKTHGKLADVCTGYRGGMPVHACHPRY